jgi:hypothetical protein
MTIFQKLLILLTSVTVLLNINKITIQNVVFPYYSRVMFAFWFMPKLFLEDSYENNLLQNYPDMNKISEG